MKILSALVLTCFLAGSVAMAADAENSASQTSDTSKNPLTGSVTKTKKMKRKIKNKNGKSSEAEVTDKVTTKKNGEVKEDVKVDADSKPAN